MSGPSATQRSLPLRLPTVTRSFTMGCGQDFVEHLVDNGDGTFHHRWHDQGNDVETCRVCGAEEDQ